jgi:RimJ/RimL family protein N-acetyltransferase
VVERATGALIGEVGCQDRFRDINPPLEGTLEAVWTLTTAAHGKGYATEAMHGFLGHVDRHHAGRRVTCLIPTGHAASLRVAAKLGFTPFAQTIYKGAPVTLLERHRRA